MIAFHEIATMNMRVQIPLFVGFVEVEFSGWCWLVNVPLNTSLSSCEQAKILVVKIETFALSSKMSGALIFYGSFMAWQKRRLLSLCRYWGQSHCNSCDPNFYWTQLRSLLTLVTNWLSLASTLPLMFCRGYEVESWSRFWYELNPRARCAFGNVLKVTSTKTILTCPFLIKK